MNDTFVCLFGVFVCLPSCLVLLIVLVYMTIILSSIILCVEIEWYCALGISNVFKLNKHHVIACSCRPYYPRHLCANPTLSIFSNSSAIWSWPVVSNADISPENTSSVVRKRNEQNQWAFPADVGSFCIKGKYSIHTTHKACKYRYFILDFSHNNMYIKHKATQVDKEIAFIMCLHRFYITEGILS